MVRPLLREGPALVRLDGIDAAEIVGCEPGARAIGATLQDKTPAVGREFGILRNEGRLVLAEERGDPGDLSVRDAHNAVWDSAARPASPAFETGLNTIHYAFIFLALTHKAIYHNSVYRVCLGGSSRTGVVLIAEEAPEERVFPTTIPLPINANAREDVDGPVFTECLVMVKPPQDAPMNIFVAIAGGTLMAAVVEVPKRRESLSRFRGNTPAGGGV